MDPLLQCIEDRYVALLRRLGAGDDAPPAMQLRLEGLLEAAVLTGTMDEASLDAWLEDLHQRERGCSLGGDLCTDHRANHSADLRPGWRRAYVFPALPLFAARAPVSPSTGD